MKNKEIEGTSLESTPLYNTACKHDLKDVEELIANSADVNSKYEDGWTFLHWTGFLGVEIDRIEEFIANGADINAKDDGGWTPLHYASLMNRREIVQLFIAKGAEIGIKANDGKTPLDVAKESTKYGSHDKIITYLTQE